MKRVTRWEHHYNNDMQMIKVKDDVDGLAGKTGTVMGTSEDGCAYGQMYEILFENGNSEWLMEADLDFI